LTNGTLSATLISETQLNIFIMSNIEKIVGQLYKFGDLSYGEVFYLPKLDVRLMGHHQKLERDKLKLLLGLRIS